MYDSITNGYKLDPRNVVLTFDDGYKNNLEVIFPFLSSINIPFTVFISTKHVQSGRRFPTYILRVAIFNNHHTMLKISCLNKEFDISTRNKQINVFNYINKIIKTTSQNQVNAIINELSQSMSHDDWLEINDKYSSDKPMAWGDVDKLHSTGVTIGSHCHDHFILHSNQFGKSYKRQLNISKSLIEKRYGDCSYFCYPNGTFNDISHKSYDFVKEIYSLSFTTCFGEVSNTTNRHLLPRLHIPKDLDYFKFKMNTSSLGNMRYKKSYNLFFKNVV